MFSISKTIKNKLANTPGVVVDSCTPNPCQNGGYCVLNGSSCNLFNVNETFRCTCPPHFTGKRCESKKLKIYFNLALLAKNFYF